MDTSELQKLAQDTRSKRQINIALLVSSAFLFALLFVPLAFKSPRVPITATLPATSFASVPLQAKAAIVYDLVTGETLYEKNADAQLPLASLTKLLTVYAALAELSPNTPITISANTVGIESPRAFNAGQTFALADLARLTLTASLNDGAAAIAEATAQRENVSQNEMLASAAIGLGLSQTFALNGNGLDVSGALSGGYGSARDLAHLAGALVAEAPTIAAATTKAFAEAVSLGGTSYKVKNTDPIIETIPGLLLSKTGFTDLAGGNLALVFDTGIRHAIAIVVLGSTQASRFTDTSALVAATLAHFANSAGL